VGLRPGVTDSVAESLIRGARVIGVTLQQAATARRYIFHGRLSTADVQRIARELLCNEIIHVYSLDPLKPPFAPPAEASEVVETVALRGTSDETLKHISATRSASRR